MTHLKLCWWDHLHGPCFIIHPLPFFCLLVVSWLCLPFVTISPKETIYAVFKCFGLDFRMSVVTNDDTYLSAVHDFFLTSTVSWDISFLIMYDMNLMDFQRFEYWMVSILYSFQAYDVIFSFLFWRLKYSSLASAN